MSNGKKWRDAKKVHRDKHHGFSRLIGGKKAKTAGNKCGSVLKLRTIVLETLQ